MSFATRLTLPALLLCILVQSAAAETYYVRAGGNDDADGKTGWETRQP